MDLKHLRHFVAIVDNGTFLAAAKAIHLSQSALSRSLQNLEVDLGTTLLHRSTRGIQITESGERFYRRAKLILGETEKAILEAKTPIKIPTLNVGMAPLFAGHVLPEVIRLLSQASDKLKINVISDLFPDLIEKLLSGAIDIAVSNLPFADIPDDLIVEPLIDISIVYVASASHPLAKSKRCSFKNLSNFPWAVVDEQHANDLYQYILTSEGQTGSPISLKTNSLTLLKSVISKPPFITLLPKHMVMQDVTDKKLAILRTDQETLRRKGGVIYRKADLPQPSRDLLKKMLRDLAS